MSTHAKDILAFYEKFGVPHRSSPGLIEKKDLLYKLAHIQEELDEARDAVDERDLTKLVDSLIDIVYVTIGTALNVGLSPELWQRCWDLVHLANMAKRRVECPAESKRNHAWDIVKPVGWVAPDAAINTLLFEAALTALPAARDPEQQELFPNLVEPARGDEQC